MFGAHPVLSEYCFLCRVVSAELDFFTGLRYSIFVYVKMTNFEILFSS